MSRTRLELEMRECNLVTENKKLKKEIKTLKKEIKELKKCICIDGIDSNCPQHKHIM